MAISFISLPRDIKYNIVKILPLPDFLALVCCHKSLLLLVQDENFWYHKFQHDFKNQIFAKPETFTFKIWYQLTKILITETDPYVLDDRSNNEFVKHNYERSALLMMAAGLRDHSDIKNCLWDINSYLLIGMITATQPFASYSASELYPKVVSYLKGQMNLFESARNPVGVNVCHTE